MVGGNNIVPRRFAPGPGSSTQLDERTGPALSDLEQSLMFHGARSIPTATGFGFPHVVVLLSLHSS